MKALTLLLLSTLVFSCNASKKKSSSSGAINATAPYKWSATFPLKLKVSEDFTTNEQTAIGLMATAWTTAVAGKKTFFEIESTTTEKSNAVANLDRLYDSEMGVYKTVDWPEDLPGSALAVTQIFGERHNIGKANEYVKILHADILVNDDYYDFDTADSGPNFDFRTVLLHEMGHFLGLQHKSITRSLTVMYPSIDPNENKRAPLAVDISDIADRYDINMGASGMSAIVSGAKINYTSDKDSVGTPVKIILELHANGDCVHKESGLIVQTHHVSLKSH